MRSVTRFAARRLGDLQSIEGLVIMQGSAVIRAEYTPESPALENLAVATRIPERETHVLTVPDLPSLAGLVVEISDQVEEGQLIARYIDDAALAERTLEVEATRAQVPVLEKRIIQARKAHEGKLKGLRKRLAAAQNRVSEVRFLVASDALPRARVVAAADTVARLQQAEQEALTTWTSRLSSLQTELQAARLVVRQAEAKRQQAVAKRWVRSPLAGQVVDVRVVDVSVAGVTLEVLVDQTEPNGLMPNEEPALHKKTELAN